MSKLFIKSSWLKSQRVSTDQGLRGHPYSQREKSEAQSREGTDTILQVCAPCTPHLLPRPCDRHTGDRHVVPTLGCSVLPCQALLRPPAAG